MATLTWRRPTWVRIPRDLEASHTMIMGGTGTGKSSLIRQRLLQIEERGETAIVLDQGLEFTSQFFNPRRGDVILNPIDARCPFWNPTDELRLDAEALTLAKQLHPERPRDSPFFTQNVQDLIAYLITCRPENPRQLMTWCFNAHGELDALVRDTNYEKLLVKTAPLMRDSMLASLNEMAKVLVLLPDEDDAHGRWSANAWAEHRQGWIFLPTTPSTRDQLAPLVSLWLNTLILRLMDTGQERPTPPRRVSLVLDEVASLPKLTHLSTALTEYRKSGHPVLLGFQSREQIVETYGDHLANVILEQAATVVYLRTKGAQSAKWVQDSIGQVKTQRITEGHSTGRNRHHNHNLVVEEKPLIMASEIAGLPKMHGYLQIEGWVTPIVFPAIDLPNRCLAFVERAPRQRLTRQPPSIDSPDAPSLMPPVNEQNEYILIP